MELQTLLPWLLFAATLVWFFFLTTKTLLKSPKTPSSSTAIPKSYPVFGSAFALSANFNRRVQWISDILQTIPSSTFVFHRSFGSRQVFTADPAVVHHILKTNFPCYGKGIMFYQSINDLLGDGIFTVDGEAWKSQRQIASHEFNTKSLRKFVETVVDVELSNRLLPILSEASINQTTLDFQDILQRFTFDNICMIAFGYDPEYLLPSFPETPFATAFDEGTRLSSQRLTAVTPLIWKVKKILNIGTERRLKEAVAEVRGLARKIVRAKKKELEEKAVLLESVDLLSRFLSSGHSDESFVIDIVISFIIAGRDTTSAALTWFFWLLSKHSHVENEILKEVDEKSETVSYDEVKDMVYTHAALCESMRLYPPLPVDTKEAAYDDVLPDGTEIKKRWRVTYHVYAMGRSEKIWGPDWAEFRPERWLRRDVDGKWSFVGMDHYSYPVFQAGPRVCLGKEMAFLQMKRVVAGIMREFRVVPTIEERVEPEYTAYITSVMTGGFPVKIENRINTNEYI